MRLSRVEIEMLLTFKSLMLYKKKGPLTQSVNTTLSRGIYINTYTISQFCNLC